MNLERYITDQDYLLTDGIHLFKNQDDRSAKLNRIDVLEELGRGRVWKNVYAHYFRFLFVLRWLRPNTVLVDVGCGRCWLMDMIYRNQMKVSYVGVDLSMQSLRYASKKKFKYERLLMRANCNDMPLSNSFADYVVCLEMIEHNDKETAESIIRRCYQLMKPGGILFISTPNRKGREMVFPTDHIYEWQLHEMTNFLRTLGLSVDGVFGCFGKKRELLRAMDEAEKQIYLRLAGYFSWHVLSPFFSLLHPEQSQGSIWLCRKPH